MPETGQRGASPTDLAAGTRLLVVDRVSARCLVAGENPAVPARDCQLWPGLELLVEFDAVPEAPALLCRLHQADRWESLFVSSADRFASGYQGFRLLVQKSDLGRAVRVRPETGPGNTGGTPTGQPNGCPE